MGGVAKAIGGLTGGLLGGQIEKPKRPPKAQETQVDPDRGAQIAAARRKRFQQARAAGRSSFRIDLGGTGAAGEVGQTRSGITIA